MMTIKQLKTYLQGLDTSYDDCVILRPSGDHSYALADASLMLVEVNGRQFFEYFDDDNMSPGSKSVKALVVE